MPARAASLREHRETVHARVPFAHPVGEPQSAIESHEAALTDAGTVLPSAPPGGGRPDQLGPEREDAALGRFGRVYGAPVFSEEVALRIARLAQAQQVLGTVNVLPLEGAPAESEE